MARALVCAADRLAFASGAVLTVGAAYLAGGVALPHGVPLYSSDPGAAGPMRLLPRRQ